MPKLNEIQTYKRDNLLVELLFKSKGKANVVSRYEIAKYLADNGYPSKPDCVHSIVRKVRNERKIPICHVNSEGYFWAENSQEIRDSIIDLEKRVAALNESIQFLKSFIFE
jgi:hypothetical protein